MKKFLRYYLVVLMALFCGTMMAQTTIWSEDWSGYQANDVPSKNNTNYSQVDGASATKIYDENLAGGTKPELLIGKTGSGKTGSFTAKIALNGATGEMNLAYKANYDRITVSASPSSVTLGEKTKSGNDYLIPVTVPSGVSEIELTFTNSNSSNVRFDNVKLYQGTAKKPAGLSWGTASRSVTIGADDNVFPTLTNENNLTVVYSSSETSVATINVNGEITLVAAGETKITASFAGNDEYESGEVSYTLTVKESSGGTTSTEITVAKALEITNALENGKTTTEEYKVKGFIVSTPDFQRKPDGSLYGNVNLTIADEKGGTSTLTIYHGKYIGNVLFTEQTITTIKEGDEVVFQGKLQKYVKDEVITPELTSCYLISVNGNTEPQTPEITIGEASDINEFKNQPKDKPYKLTLENAQVVYAWTSSSDNTNAYVRDATGAICMFFKSDYKTLAENFATNKMLNGSIIMSNGANNGLPQASATAETNTDKLTITDGSAPEPVKITTANVSKNLCDLVLLENVTITKKDDGKFYVDDVQLYNQFKLEAYNDFTSYVGEGKTIKGIAGIYKKGDADPIYEIFPIEITGDSGSGGDTPVTTSSMIKFAEGDSAADGTVFTSGDLKLTLLDKNDPAKMAVDGNDAYFGTAEDYQKFDHRLKTGGKSGSKNSLTLTIPTDGTLKVYVRSASSSATDRNLVLTQDEKELYNQVVKDEDAITVTMKVNDEDKDTPVYPVVSVDVKKGEVTVGYPTGALNFYAFELVTTTGINDVIVNPFTEDGYIYNLKGQRVENPRKGIYIKNGKKFVVK